MGVATPRLCQGGSYDKKTYYQLAVRDPGAVPWYCTVELEMAAALTAALLTEQLQSDDVPGRGDAQQKIEAQLRSRMGCDISVADIPELRYLARSTICTRPWSGAARVVSSMCTWLSGWSVPLV